MTCRLPYVAVATPFGSSLSPCLQAAESQASVKVALTDMSAAMGMGPAGRGMMEAGQGMMGHGMMGPGQGMMGYGWSSPGQGTPAKARAGHGRWVPA